MSRLQVEAAASGQRGVSLIEALVALLVMSFGILGVVGMQASLRSNADVAKQRSEAVRIAEEAIEQKRSYSQLASGGGIGYGDIVTESGVISGYTTNTSYTLNLEVQDAQASDISEARLRSLVADVSWQDRAGITQQISVGTNIAGVAPELAGSLSLPAVGAPTQQANGRNPRIPVAASDLGDGTSSFSPPGGGGVRWIFDNSTGLITQLCSPACTNTSLLLLSGYVRFALTSPPTAVDAEIPVSSVPAPPASFAVTVAQTLPSPAAPPPACFKEDFPTYIAYYCALAVTTSSPARWSGQALVTATGATISSSLLDADASHYKVCRYTPGRNEDSNLDTFADGDVPVNGNIDHPLNYAGVTRPLNNQNFLVILAGDGTNAFDCPGDNAATPVFNSNTWRHQPHA